MTPPPGALDRRAAAAHYQRKRDGRNRVSAFRASSMPEPLPA